VSDTPFLGAQDQGDGASQHNASDFHIQQAISQINTAVLVKIIRPPYDKDGKDIDPGSIVPVGYVDVQPMVHQIDGRGQPTPHGTVFRLSYHRVQGGRNAIISDPEKGDIGQMVVNSRDTSIVRSTNDVANPGSRRKFDMADGIYVGSPQQKEKPLQYVTFTKTGVIVHDKNGWQITTNEDGIKLEAKGNTITMEEDGVKINGALINKDGDLVTKKGVNVDTHTHNQGHDSHGDSEVPTDEPNVG
jgi:hypothetical protein